MDDIRLLPPLRLVLNTACNGRCFFCHHEGCDGRIGEMPWNIINESIEAARRLSISKISLTGGEPTLRDDLCDIISTIKRELPDVNLGITTNGYGLSHLPREALDLLDNINLSIISFVDEKYKKYQGVDPIFLFDFLRDYVHKATVNVVVVDENKDELIPIIEKCFDYGFSVDLMFELCSNNISLQKSVLSVLTSKYGLFSIHYGSTPVMIQFEKNEKLLRIKAPSISNILQRSICQGCPQHSDCPEKVCALRVYPDGTVTPCLNGYVQSSRESVMSRISELYPRLGVCMDDLYDFYFK